MSRSYEYVDKDKNLTNHGLKVLTDFVEKNIGQEDFDMKDFRGFRNYEGHCLYANYSNNPFLYSESCGSVGCFMGWLTHAIADKENKSLGSAIVDHLPLDEGGNFFIGEIHHPRYDYLLDSAWADRDNTVKGAVARARKYLASDGPFEVPWKK